MASIFVGLCESRMTRLIDECKWETRAGINPESLIRWRQTAMVTVGKARNKASNVRLVGARTQNHYLETARAFCLWAVKRGRMPANPLERMEGVETAGQLRRQRRALTEERRERMGNWSMRLGAPKASPIHRLEQGIVRHPSASRAPLPDRL